MFDELISREYVTRFLGDVLLPLLVELHFHGLLCNALYSHTKYPSIC
jgi:hypothetical protein